MNVYGWGRFRMIPNEEFWKGRKLIVCPSRAGKTRMYRYFLDGNEVTHEQFRTAFAEEETNMNTDERRQALIARYPVLARIDEYTTMAIERGDSPEGLNVRIGDYPAVWDVLIEANEPEDEDEFLTQAERCYDALMRYEAQR